jgi:ComF family protein
VSGAGALAAPALRRLRRAGIGLLDALLPPRCLACGEEVAEPGLLCGPCWSAITFLGPPHCACCGLPFAFENAPGLLCGSCAGGRPEFDRARAVMRYDDASRGLVLSFKHGDRTDAAPAYGLWLRRAGAELLDDADGLVPVPLHWTRLFLRRYNQAALLADALRRAGGPPVLPDLLVRRRRTPSQGHLGRLARARNVRSAFALKRGADIAGRRLVLVDDVMTTGATAAECARVLKRAGAARVDVLTLARALG